MEPEGAGSLDTIALARDAEQFWLLSFFGEESPVLQVRVFYHDKCFDGACSASLFTRFHRECFAGHAAQYSYHGLVHRAGALFDESDFTGDENAIVDFKYSASPRITWWFDHHLSAFLTPQDQEHFQRCRQDPTCASRKFFDPTYISCTSFLADIATARFGFDTRPVAELIHWANIVDGALYESPEAAVEMAAPAMKLTLMIESTQDPAFIPRLIPLLTEMPLAEVLAQPFVASCCRRCSSATSRPSSSSAPRRGARRHHLLRHHRPSHRGIQQVHPLLPAPPGDLLHRLVQIQLPHQSRGWLEPLDQGRSRQNGQPGRDLRALRRRRTRPRRRHQLPPQSGRQSPRGGPRNCGGVAGEEPGVTRIRQLLNRNCGLQDGPACLEYKDVPPACGKLEPR